MSTQEQIVEHVVLFKVKSDADPGKVAALVDKLNGFTSLGLTIHLTVEKLLRCQSSSLSFTHMFHSRHKSKDVFQEYMSSPMHEHISPEIKHIVDDVMVVDWISNGVGVPLKPGSVMRVTFLKLKENLGEDKKASILEAIKGIKDEFQAIQQLSFGENFSHLKAKGYSIASLIVLPRLTDLEALDSNVKLVKENVKDLIDNMVVVDYEIPPSMATNL